MVHLQRLGPETKIQILSSQLREMAFELGPKAKLPTVDELCSLFKTTRVTLNDALNILENQNIILRRRGSGIFVSPKLYTKCIYILFYSYLFMAKKASPFWGMLWGLFAQEIERRSTSKEEEFQIHLILQPPDGAIALPEDLINTIRTGKVHGILSTGMHADTMEWLTTQNIPSVTYAGLGTGIVTADTKEFMRQAVESLAHEGCRRIGLIGSAVNLSSLNIVESIEIEQHFHTEMSNFGLSIDRDLIVYEVFYHSPGYETDDDPTFQEQGYKHAKAIFSNPTIEKPDGLVIDNDMLTTGVLIALQELGIHPGRDIKIASHSNIGSPMLFGNENKLILIEYNPAEFVQTMFQLLDRLMAGEKLDQQIVLIQPKVRYPS